MTNNNTLFNSDDIDKLDCNSGEEYGKKYKWVLESTSLDAIENPDINKTNFALWRPIDDHPNELCKQDPTKKRVKPITKKTPEYLCQTSKAKELPTIMNKKEYDSKSSGITECAPIYNTRYFFNNDYSDNEGNGYNTKEELEDVICNDNICEKYKIYKVLLKDPSINDCFGPKIKDPSEEVIYCDKGCKNKCENKDDGFIHICYKPKTNQTIQKYSYTKSLDKSRNIDSATNKNDLCVMTTEVCSDDKYPNCEYSEWSMPIDIPGGSSCQAINPLNNERVNDQCPDPNNHGNVNGIRVHETFKKGVIQKMKTRSYGNSTCIETIPINERVLQDTNIIEQCDLSSKCPENCIVSNWSTEQCPSCDAPNTVTNTRTVSDPWNEGSCVDSNTSRNIACTEIQKARCCNTTDYVQKYYKNNTWSTEISNTEYDNVPCDTTYYSRKELNTSSCANGNNIDTHIDVQTKTGESCPVDCVGNWGTCENGVKTYTITTPAENGGRDCPYNNSDTSTEDCPQPVDCVGNWGTCENGVKTYTITTPAENGGDNCLYSDGDTSTEDCPQPLRYCKDLVTGWKNFQTPTCPTGCGKNSTTIRHMKSSKNVFGSDIKCELNANDGNTYELQNKKIWMSQSLVCPATKPCASTPVITRTSTSTPVITRTSTSGQNITNVVKELTSGTTYTLFNDKTQFYQLDITPEIHSNRASINLASKKRATIWTVDLALYEGTSNVSNKLSKQFISLRTTFVSNLNINSLESKKTYKLNLLVSYGNFTSLSTEVIFTTL